jgi:Zn-dependent metalloprotease
MKNFLQIVYTKDFALNDKDELKQNERNDFRNATIDALVDALSDIAGVECLRTLDGVGIAIPNENLGAIPVVIGVTIKDLNFDIQDANNEYLEKEMDKIAKAKAKEVEKERKIAEKEALALARKNKNSKK